MQNVSYKTYDCMGTAWDRIVTSYERFFEPFTRKLARHAIKLAKLKPEDKVLDVGCGTGALAIQAAEKGADVTGIDISDLMIDELLYRADKHHVQDKITGLVMDAQQIQLETNRFDVVFVNLSWNFLKDPQQALKEIYRVLHPHGRLVIVAYGAPDRIEFLQLAKDVLDELSVDFNIEDVFWSFVNDETQLQSDIEAQGFKSVRVLKEDQKCVIPNERAWRHIEAFSPALYEMLKHLDERQRGQFYTKGMERLYHKFGAHKVTFHVEIFTALGYK